ncbi:MAG: DsbA family protein [Proteobacteria bacterium]|nr:DsbA family protein [Pseudomonadota bacterium]
MRGLVIAGGLAFSLLLSGFCASAQQGAAPGASPPPAQSAAPRPAGPPVSIYDLMLPGPIPENTLGSETAPVTIVEYASLTCPHCASFHTESMPHLKKAYIDTGKVRFVFRDFPFDGVAAAGTMIARCAPQDKFFAITDALFREQQVWAFGADPEKALTDVALRFGFTQKTFDECLQKQALYDGILAVRKRAHEVFKVDSTPTLFVNGVPYRGGLSPEQLDAVLKPLLPANQ